jgi:CheY-like chemotaxis protein
MTRLATILVVDDDTELRQLLTMLLAEPGYRVLDAADGYEALRVLTEHQVDLVITDIKMPGLSGFQFARQARLIRPGLHVMYISAYHTAADKSGPRLGLLVQKPFRAEALLEAIDRELKPQDE